MQMLWQILHGCIGVSIILLLAWIMSEAKRSIPWRVIVGGISLQFLLALSVLKIGFIASGFEVVAGWFVSLLGYTHRATEFLFGPLADSSKLETAFGPGAFILALEFLPPILFFSALTSLLYYYGILQKVIAFLAWVMRRAMRLTGAETLAAAANVFVGLTEAPLFIKPYLAKMSRSEILALMTGGMATLAGGTMAVYVSLLGGGTVEAQQHFAKMLLCASVMNAPAALVIAKIICPNQRTDFQLAKVSSESTGENALDAIARGTSQGLKLALNVGAMLIVFLALIFLVNGVLAWVGGWGGAWLDGVIFSWTGGRYEGLSLEALCGIVFTPLAWVAGAEGSDILPMGQLLGVKTIANEFIGFLSMRDMQLAGVLSERGVFLSTFALCGFANFGSIGIQIGGIGILAPERRSEAASLALKAMIGGTLASVMSAAVAGMLL